VNEPIVGAIAALLARSGHVYMVVTNFGARGRSLLSPYSWFVQPKDLGLAIKRRVAQRMRLPEDHPDVRNRVCSNLHLGGLARIDPNTGQPTNLWPSTDLPRPMGNHAKFYMVDDRVFYIGSHNMYPITATSVEPREWWRVLQGSLQEYGYIIDDAAAAKQLMEQYWTPIWEPTRLMAVSGGVPPCQL
jgi:phosphatidylserine/phosphatidylglycerophosphate/cardiolipin synthase-like enzyme